jgi:serine/threonine-protein kinase RsbW
LTENRLQIGVSVAEVRKVCEFVVRAARDAGLDEDAVYHCEIAVEEACINIIQHGFEGQTSASSHLEVSTRQDANYFIILLSDNSSPFDPLSQADPDLAAEIGNMEPGGLGIYFFKKLMDSVSYKYSQGENQLTLRKRLPG